MELKEGMYVRTVTGEFYKINKIDCDRIIFKDYCWLSIENVKTASYNIIELIKTGDILLGKDGRIYQCWKVYKDYVFTYSKNKEGIIITLVDYQIDRVLTKEQFEQVSYKVGD